MHAAFAPVPDAGADFSMDERAPGMLDGSASFDLDGNPLRYSWLQTGGPPVVLSDRNAAMPTFVAPQVAISETLLFELRLRERAGQLQLRGHGTGDREQRPVLLRCTGKPLGVQPNRSNSGPRASPAAAAMAITAPTM